MTDTLPPKPEARPDKVSLWRYMQLFRKDILSAQPAKLYRAWMAEFRTPFFRSFMVNQPELIKTVLKDRPDDFPKSARVGEGLRPLRDPEVPEDDPQDKEPRDAAAPVPRRPEH